MSFHLFHHISLPRIDPLGGGLREEIEAERLEPEAFTLEESTPEEQERYFQAMQDDMELNPESFRFTDD